MANITDRLRRDHALCEILPHLAPAPINPDGPRAADIIDRMVALIADCEESFTADDTYPLLRDACRKILADCEVAR